MVLFKLPSDSPLYSQGGRDWVSPGRHCCSQIDSFCSSLKIHILYLAFSFNILKYFCPQYFAPVDILIWQLQHVYLAFQSHCTALFHTGQALQAALVRGSDTQQRIQGLWVNISTSLLPHHLPTTSAYGYFSSILPPPTSTPRTSCLDELQPTWPPRWRALLLTINTDQKANSH